MTCTLMCSTTCIHVCTCTVHLIRLAFITCTKLLCAALEDDTPPMPNQPLITPHITNGQVNSSLCLLRKVHYVSVIAHMSTMHPTGGTFQGMLSAKFNVTKRYLKEQFRYVVCTASCNSKTISIACVGAPTTTADLHNFHSLLFTYGYL